MNDKTIGKLVTDNDKLVAFTRTIFATELTTEKVIHRLVDFSTDTTDEFNFATEADLVEAFKAAVAGNFSVAFNKSI